MANIFEQFTNCLRNKDYQEPLGFNSFIFCRFLGSSPKTLKAANTINMFYKNLNDESQYNFVRHIESKPTFIRFLKADIQEDDEQVNILVKKYNISKEKAREYLTYFNRKNNRL